MLQEATADSAGIVERVVTIPIFVQIGWLSIAFAWTVLAFWVLSKVVRAYAAGWSFKAWLGDLATTQYRIVINIWVSVAVVVALMVGLLLEAQGVLLKDAMQEDIIDSILLFLAAMVGLDVTAFVAKRATYKPSPPNPPDVEDAAAVASDPVNDTALQPLPVPTNPTNASKPGQGPLLPDA